ncbi:rhomboid family protein [Alkalitalea saponilacus]|uniref:Membrane associated serine protease, rhomboid family n=1 Tax=Alkalitalea saponilacus TaxID=889453 RepID=A0A1T5A280_9BACT|nr:rhomboid family intramembrane serine protease [Alkalitalea saponilacus]ASB48895.1 rhomboid family intramembrane serine protease [Alkalitalea saponilacus]SKB29088.1 Membrane associated serine protease, rhomboid family [Alkalitalea saponilacus]
MSIIREIKESFKYGTILTRLIYINIGVFLAFRFIQLFLVLSGWSPDAIRPWLAFFSVPSEPARLLVRPWTVLTYMFLHFDFIHVLFNILYLYWFGRLFLQIIGSRLFLKTYFLGGIAGAAVYLLAYNLVPAFYNVVPSSILLGASASVMAILFAVARFSPDHTVFLLFFGSVKLKYIALVAFIIDLISIPALSNTGGHLAHMGGAVVGLYLGWQWSKKGTGSYSGIPSHFKKSEMSKLFAKKKNLKVTHKRPLSDLEYNAIKTKRLKEVDRILEKIKTSGYDSLTAEEKKILFEASQDND